VTFLDIVAWVGVSWALLFMVCMFLAWRSDRRSDPYRTHPPRSNVWIVPDLPPPFDQEKD
jgi:hypothetical protein